MSSSRTVSANSLRTIEQVWTRRRQGLLFPGQTGRTVRSSEGEPGGVLRRDVHGAGGPFDVDASDSRACHVRGPSRQSPKEFRHPARAYRCDAHGRHRIATPALRRSRSRDGDSTGPTPTLGASRRPTSLPAHRCRGDRGICRPVRTGSIRIGGSSDSGGHAACRLRWNRVIGPESESGGAECHRHLTSGIDR